MEQQTPNPFGSLRIAVVFGNNKANPSAVIRPSANVRHWKVIQNFTPYPPPPTPLPWRLLQTRLLPLLILLQPQSGIRFSPSRNSRPLLPPSIPSCFPSCLSPPVL